jgi:CHASE2 domain-containing sensor protein
LASQLKDRIVLIGIDRPLNDRHRTPFSAWAGDDMLGVLIQATIVAQLIDGRSYTELNSTQMRIFLITLGLLGFSIGWLFWRRHLDLTSRSAATLALVAIDAAVYWKVRIILPFTLALASWLVGVNLGHHLHALAAWFRAAKMRAGANSH